MAKKLISLIAAVICIATACISTASAVDVVYDINYWYSDSSDIGIWPVTKRTLNTCVNSYSDYSSLSKSNIMSYLSSARTSWSCVEKNYNYVSQSSDADLVIYAVTRDLADSVGLPSSALGVTYPKRPNRMGTLLYGASEKGLYRIDSAAVFLVGEGIMSTTANARKATVHEMGHVFGYYGHYDGGNVMKTHTEDIVSIYPSTNEANHLGQIN